jgi:hypothetical protein
MIEAPEESVAIKFVNDIEKLIRSKIKWLLPIGNQMEG